MGRDGRESRYSIGQYSRGMKQRIGIAETIVHEPSIIFLDEPTLGLVSQGQKDIQSIITRLNQEQNVTVFITSHLLKEISEICNRVAIVKQGKLLEEGYLDELIKGYRLVLRNENPTLEDIFFSLTTDEVGGASNVQFNKKRNKGTCLFQKRRLDFLCNFHSIQWFDL